MHCYQQKQLDKARHLDQPLVKSQR
ncbi:TPA: tetratricopeptide repeat protein [Aeromonas sobria]|nr:tetratricopeptide repeat protein [Aeromonas sobria]